MNIDFAFICDYAEAGNKINAMGIGFDTIFAQKVPARHPQFFLVFQTRANVVEAGEKNLKVSLIDADGKDIMPPLTAKFVVERPPTGTESVGKIALGLGNIAFPRYGDYSIHATVDGEEKVRIPLKVAPPPQAQ